LMTLLSPATSYLPSDNSELLAVCFYCVGGATALFCLVNEKSKSFWRSSWRWRRGFWVWLLLLAVVVFLTTANHLPSNNSERLATVIFCVASATALFCLVIFIRWLCCWRNFRRFLWGLVCLVVLILLFYAEEDWRGKHAWEKFKHEWKVKGEQFDFASFIPPPVPDNQNFALTPIVASSWEASLDKNGHRVVPYNTNVVDRLEMSIYGDYTSVEWPTNGYGYWVRVTKTDLKVWQQYYRALAAKTNKFPVAPQPQSPAADVLLALSKYDSVIEELRQASRLPYSRFPLNYDPDHPFDTLLPHYAALKRCSQVLQLRAIAELDLGQTGKALDDVKLALRLTDSIRTEPFLISHLVRFALVEITLQPIWQGLAENKWSETQLAELERELGKLDFLADFQFSMRGERAGAIGTIDYFRRHRDYHEFAGLFFILMDDDSPTYWHHSIDWRNCVRARGLYLMPDGWFYQNELVVGQTCQWRFLPMVDTRQQLVSPEISRQADNFMRYWKATPWNVFARMILPAFGTAAKRSCRQQTSMNLARVACALERYRLAHGVYPETLDVLAPQFIDQLPHDIINGQPLHYHRTDDLPSQGFGAASGQFVLYSVGWNEKDDGGTVSLYPSGKMARLDDGDWVWRYPAK
jgi:tetratricopeptide (TPR) repeat protein